ncbi:MULTISPECIES: lactonase family protein [unclassified Lentimonas]|uniref:lactonase family protein n=1 Tax=unclassified Lentimonas TaxID=2630993 RepID=UPI001326A3CF|nr:MULTISPECIES: lactonase family protein [unclassified Lentimonas]CAA6677421.1 6-phosphogluconolactonase (EC [Lentimonas sp. CC4]CAA6686391.1 6-phosphogluconolactonase (EC [Lentimonas sp. CC6]CAA7074667.1 6-phosphogluconolactonase (EC [Lentimonas sp. CC4]CAA7169290.1 6-phosphogluconolactonase (EC [Lentimonas sp. CC21]CAA7180316.1 6-phosphogluconolactonase (EC [Lentimonas sp. CC8]
MNDLIRATLLLLTLLCSQLQAEQTQVYFGTSNSTGIYTATLDTELGILSPITLAAKIKSPGFIALHPKHPFLYATTSGFEKPNTAGVAAFRIKDDGTLHLINTLPSSGNGACHVSIDSTGQSLVLAHYSSGSAAAFKIKPDGSLVATNSLHTHTGSGKDPKRQQRPHPHSAFIHPNNQFVYVPDLGIDKVMIYRLFPDQGIITPAGHADVPGGSQGPRHMKFSADGKQAYVLNELSLNVATYTVDLNTGQLHYLDTDSVLSYGSIPEKMTCAEIRVHPNGNFIYTSTRDLDKKGRDTLSTFTRSENGSLQLIANTPASVSVPRNFNIDPSGQWLIVGGQKSSTLAIFAVDPKSGALTLKQTDIPFDGGAICVEFVK